MELLDVVPCLTYEGVLDTKYDIPLFLAGIVVDSETTAPSHIIVCGKL
jgi:hypothetical protein